MCLCDGDNKHPCCTDKTKQTYPQLAQITSTWVGNKEINLINAKFVITQITLFSFPVSVSQANEAVSIRHNGVKLG